VGPETDEMCQFLFSETYVKGQFLGPGTDIRGKSYFMEFIELLSLASVKTMGREHRESFQCQLILETYVHRTYHSALKKISLPENY
jgi:hypothetical protein